ncbi:MAG: ribosome small subunit-dependent GTPase A [Chloroflexi bacterium]|nr:ribosome small subunit-dependent GTPase A [Chloroflexota bacterium]
MSTKDNASNANDEGVVYKKSTGLYYVHTPERVVPCALSNRLRKQLIYPLAASSTGGRRVRQVKEIDHGDMVAIGDRVRFYDAGDGTGLIVEVLPRRNRLARRTAVPMPDAHAFEQVIVANVDQVIPVFAAASPPPHWNMLDRYLASAESFYLPALVCITKLDLVGGAGEKLNDEIQSVTAEYRRTGYPVLLVSATTGEGMEELRQALGGRTSVLVGKSGVGKTTLLNTLQPGLGLRVRELSARTGKGLHTTTGLELFPLDFGGAVLDTPGAREYGLWDVDLEDVALLFPEMRPWVGKCRFGRTCLHNEEPGCAVRKAVMTGSISPRRYQSYLRLCEDCGAP